MAFERVPGKERNYKNTETGEVISRRQYLKQLRGGTTNEAFARMNRLTNAELSELRPARGRQSALKKSDTEKEIIAQARIEDRLRKAELAEETKKQKELNRRLTKMQNRKTIKRRHITGRLLKAGRYAARIPFESYSDYVAMLAEAKSGGQIFSYGLGMHGYHESTLQELDITVFTQQFISNRPISEDNFNAAMNEELEDRMYFVFQWYWIHFAFKTEYAEAKVEKAVKEGKLPKRYLARMEANRKARRR